MINTIFSEQEKLNHYPRLMIHEDAGRLVLFISPKKGIQLSKTKNGYTGQVGEYDEHWDMSVFTDFTGSLTIQNA